MILQLVQQIQVVFKLLEQVQVLYHGQVLQLVILVQLLFLIQLQGLQLELTMLHLMMDVVLTC